MKARTVKSTIPIPEDLDQEIWGNLSRSAQVSPTGFAHQAMSSHVLLAACRHDELAWETFSGESTSRGAFTSSLIHQLGEAKDLNLLTYSALLSKMTVSENQHPQCEGKNKDRALFSGTGGSEEKTFRFSKKKGIDAGEILGVVEGTLFTIYSEDDKKLGILVAENVLDHSCALAFRNEDEKFVVPDGAKASVLSWRSDKARLKVATPSDKRIPQDVVFWVDNQKKAELCISYPDASSIQFDRLDPLMAKYAKTLKVGTLEAALSDALRGISDFNYHLYRRNKDSPLAGLVNVELARLKQTNPGQVLEEPFYRPDENINVLALKPDQETIIRIPSETTENNHEYYGVTIKNLSGRRLFPYLFYFDPTDYSIQVMSFDLLARTSI